jgi:hypothetical protein
MISMSLAVRRLDDDELDVWLQPQVHYRAVHRWFGAHWEFTDVWKKYDIEPFDVEKRYIDFYIGGQYQEVSVTDAFYRRQYAQECHNVISGVITAIGTYSDELQPYVSPLLVCGFSKECADLVTVANGGTALSLFVTGWTEQAITDIIVNDIDSELLENLRGSTQ